MNYYENDDLRFEVFKGVRMHADLEYECEEAYAKDMLTNVEIKNKIALIGVEQGKQKCKDDALLMHRGMLS